MITYQAATKKDTASIALLHAHNWQQAYKGILTDDYLNNKVEQERLEVWTKRLNTPSGNQHIITAKTKGELCGFVCLYSSHDSKYGTLLDNLHVSSKWRGKKIGKKLMALAASWVTQQSNKAGIYLWVFEDNADAIEFYDQLGGEKIEIVSEPLMGGGGYANVIRFYWKDGMGKLIIRN